MIVKNRNSIRTKQPQKITEQQWEEETAPLVSIVCNAYNHEHFIREAIEGFLMQKTTFPVEILIHDDASTDKTADIVREYEIRFPNLILPIYQSENLFSKGINPGRTYQFPRTRGKYMAICEGDDYWTDPLKLQKQVEFLEENEEYVMCYTRFQTLDQESGIFKEDQNGRYFQNEENSIDFDFQKFYDGWHMGSQTLVCRKDVFDKILPALQGYQFQRDTHIICHLLASGRGACLGNFCAVYRKHPGGIFSGKSRLHNARIAYLSYREISRKLHDEPLLHKKYIKFADKYIQLLQKEKKYFKALLVPHSLKKTMKSKILLLCIIVALLINGVSFKSGHHWGGDHAGYILQAKAIASGDFNTLENHILKTDYILNYPWGYPLLISPLVSFFDTDMNVMKYYTFGFFIIALIFIFLYFKKHQEISLLVVLFMAASPFFWEFKNNLLADLPNLCFTYLSLVLIHEFRIKQNKRTNEFLSGALIGLSIYIAYLMRNQSILLIPTLLATDILLFRKDRFNLQDVLKRATPYILFITLIIIGNYVVPIKTTSYLSQYNLHPVFLLKTIWKNVFYYINVWDELFRNTLVLKQFSMVFTGMMIGLFMIGIAKKYKEDYLSILFFALTMMLFLITPFYQGIRYLIPLIPIFLYFSIRGLSYMCQYLSEKYSKKLFYLILGGYFLLTLTTIAVYSYNNIQKQTIINGPNSANAVEMFDYLKESTDKQAIIGFRNPRLILLYTGRDAIVVMTYEKLCEKKPDFLVVYNEKVTNQMTAQQIRELTTLATEVFRNDDFTVFKINKTNLQP